MDKHAVIICGGGPTGLMLAAELALAGVDVAVVERRPNQDLPGSRAGGLHARTIEVLDQRGIADRFLEAGQTAQVAMFAGVSIDIGDFPTRHPYGLALWQNAFEAILAEWVAELPVRAYREREVVGVAQDAEGARIELADGGALRADWVVGCDGGRSVVRRSAGIAFEGWSPTTTSLIAEIRTTEVPVAGIKRDARGQHGIGPVDDTGWVRVVVREETVGGDGEPTLDAVRDAMTAVWGTDFGAHDPRWISRFGDGARQATAYRDGRVLLAGDAAHVHSPVGGQGMGTGLQDAVNLGWKLAQVARGTAPDTLLDTYHRERHPVAARVIQGTLAQTALMPDEPRIAAVRDVFGSLLGQDGVRQTLGGLLSGLDLHYDLGAGHPLLGRRMPDLDLVTPDGPRTVFSFLHGARPVLLDLTGQLDRSVAARWRDRVPVVQATYDGVWELPVVGVVDGPGSILVRPDGYVAWTEASAPSTHDDAAGPGANVQGAGRVAGTVGTTDTEGTSSLEAALGQWFGPGLTA